MWGDVKSFRRKSGKFVSMLLLAALLGGMPVYAAENRDDFRPVFDAEYYYNQYPDLQFVNIGQDPLKIEAETKEGTITVSLYLDKGEQGAGEENSEEEIVGPARDLLKKQAQQQAEQQSDQEAGQQSEEGAEQQSGQQTEEQQSQQTEEQTEQQ